MNNGCAIMDLDSIAFTIGLGNKLLDEYGQPVRESGRFVYVDKSDEELLYCADATMRTILTNSNADSYIAFIKGRGNYRYAINPEYKANRPKQSPKWWDYVKRYLVNSWGAVEVNNIEVDDAVNIARLQVPNSFIVAIDNDLLALEGTHYNWRHNNLEGQWVAMTKEDAYYKFWFDMIKGQSGDNIKGIPGYGPVAAEKILSDSKCPPARILKTYINVFGEELGIDEFYKNYKSLLILSKYEGFVIPKPIQVNKQTEEIV